MSWISDAFGSLKRTLLLWLQAALEWFPADDEPGDSNRLKQMTEDRLRDIEVSVSMRGVDSWDGWNRFRESLLEYARGRARAAGQQVVNLRADPITEYGSLVLSIAHALFLAQRGLPGAAWQNYDVLGVASIVLRDRMSALSWDDAYRELGNLGFRDARTLSAVGAVQKHLAEVIAKIASWCQTRVDAPNNPQAQNSPPAPAGLAPAANSPQPDGIDRYLERIRNGEKFPLEEQAAVVEGVLGSTLDGGEASSILIRGLAGTGKTIILAMVLPQLAARFEQRYQRPPRVLIYHFNNYLRQILMREMNAALATSTVFRRPANDLWIKYANLWDLRTIVSIAFDMPRRDGDDASRETVVQELLDFSRRPDWGSAVERFDIVLVDEGQDLVAGEFQMLSALSHDHRHMIIACDDFQNVMSGAQELVHDRLAAAMPSVRFREVALTTCVRSNPVVFSMALTTLLGPSLLNPEERQTVKDAVGLDGIRASGVLEEVPWPGRSGFYVYGARFCMFPKGPPPRIMTHRDHDTLHRRVAETIKELSRTGNGRVTLPMTVLVTGIVNQTLENLAAYLEEQTSRGVLPLVVRRSGKDVSGKAISGKRKRGSDVVHPGVINVANVLDAKGAEADVVFVIEPDDPRSGASALDKRAMFYVAATRAKVLLQVDAVNRDASSSPIMADAKAALDAFDTLAREGALGQSVGSAHGGGLSDGVLDAMSPVREAPAGVVVPAGLGVVAALNEDAIIGLTRHVDAPGTNLIDAWMDHVPGTDIAGGFGHRLIHGHHLSDVVDVYQADGLEGVWNFAQHMGRDLCTPHGLPVPGGGLIFETVNSIPGVGLDLGTAVEWLCFNVADLLSASLGALSLVRLASQTTNATTMFLASGVKLALGAATTNPLLLVGAIVGTGMGIARVVRASRMPMQRSARADDDVTGLYDTLLAANTGRLILAIESAPLALRLEPTGLRLQRPVGRLVVASS